MKSKEQINQTIERLSQLFNTDKVEYLGCNRYAIKENSYVFATKQGIVDVKMTDDDGNIIHLEDHYNEICIFRNSLAVVIKYTDKKKLGIIDENGKKLLPCLYDAIQIGFDGHIDIKKDEIEVSTSVTDIINKTFNWDESISDD